MWAKKKSSRHMSKLLTIFRAVKEENLTKPQLEDYHKELSELRGEMRLELAEITKKKALFMLGYVEVQEMVDGSRKIGKELSVAQRKINWLATTEGQREIDLKAYIGATSDNLGSLKSRLFSIY